MNAITDYELSKALHKEREAEFEQYRRLRVGDGIPQGSPKQYGVTVGVGSIGLSVLMIVHIFIS
ncbi:MAG: hypothetical protein HS126_31190 [Anaerolineales bacterium]|nr:hypothetical protein [Anaerolineales bacterium]